MAARIGRRIRRGVTGTTVAAAVMATVTAAQAPKPPVPKPVAKTTGPLTATGGTAYYTELPAPVIPGSGDSPARVIAAKAPGGAGFSDIPATVLAAYRAAEAALAKSNPGCHLPWRLLAAIGKVESVHARNGRVDSRGTASPPILGPQLNGNGFARIGDTDNGAYDGDVSYDRAVGPMQFIPSTWARWGADGNNDGTANPNNVFDAALAAGRYLCAGGRDLANPQSFDQAILSYNYSTQYLATVKSWFEFYKTGFRVVPDGSGPLPSPPDSGGSPASPSGPPPSAAGGTPGQPQPGSPPTATSPPKPTPTPSPSEAPTPTPTPAPSDPPTADPSPSDPPTADPSPSEPPAPSDPPSPSEPPAPSEPPPDPSPSPAGSEPESTPSADSTAVS